jgi:prepilin-type N-terminal cleavage/methylation domain-containing protein
MMGNRGQRTLRAGTRAGFTLIEVVIAAGLMALILASGYLCLSAGFSTQKVVEPRVEILQNARVALTLMAADLRGACPLSKDIEFLGMPRQLEGIQADNLDFATHNYTPRAEREGDFCQSSFFLDKDEQSGTFSLFRRRNPTIGLDPLSGGKRQEIARGVLGLRFQYFDGLDWYDSWGEIDEEKRTSNRERSNLSGLPEAVRITLWMDSNPNRRLTEEQTNVEPPLVFQTVARLNLAQAAGQNTASSNSTQESGTDTQSTLANPNPGGNQ